MEASDTAIEASDLCGRCMPAPLLRSVQVILFVRVETEPSSVRRDSALAALTIVHQTLHHFTCCVRERRCKIVLFGCGSAAVCTSIIQLYLLLGHRLLSAVPWKMSRGMRNCYPRYTV